MKTLFALLGLALLAVSTLIASTPLFANPIITDSSASPVLAVATTLTPNADAFVNSTSPSTNYGAATQLRVDGSPVTNSYLRFSISGLTGTFSKVTLRMYANSSISTGYTVRAVANTTWTESTITYGNAPAMGTAIGTSAAVSTGTWTQVDVTKYVTGNGTYTLGLTSSNATALSLASRESTYAPQLVITSATPKPSPTPTKTAAPPTATATRVPPTATATATSVPPTATATATSVPPTATATATAVPPTATPTNIPSPTATPTGGNYQPTAPIRAAFFYPWFPQAWTQLGIYPYTNYHPTWGYYSSTNDAIIDQQITLAAQTHLDAFISSWWGQGHHTDTALQYILGRSERAGSPNPNLRWAIYYELESGGDPSSTTILNDLQYLAGKVFNQPAYLRVNGKPVVFVYAGANDACGMADRWVAAKNAFGGNVYLVLKVFAGYLTCASQPDSWHQYSPAVAYDQQGKFSAVASPGFWLVNNAVRLPRDPTRFETDVQKVVASGAFWQLITTWSEWGEGTAIEPATEWGTSYLDILTRNFPAR